MKLKSKVAVVTGGSKGIGRAISIKLAQAGATVIINYSQDQKTADEAVSFIKDQGGRAMAVKAPVTDFESIEKMIKQVVEKFGKIDILVNNAGINKDKLLMIMSPDEWQAVLDVNLNGLYNCCKAISRQMIFQKSGKIINLSSTSGMFGVPGQTNYSASKAGMIGFTKSLAKELSPYGILVNAIAPGYIETDMLNSVSVELKKQYTESVPLKRFGHPEEVADLVAFLASDEAAYIQGQVITIDGGLTA